MSKISLYRHVSTGLALAALLALGAAHAESQELGARDLWNQGAPPVPREPRDSPSWTNASDAGLREYVEVGLMQNREVRAARARWTAATERVPQAGALPEPVLRYGLFLRSVETRVGPQKQRLGIGQSFPWFGTLGLRKDVAAAAAEASRQMYRDVLSRTARDIVSAFAEYHYVEAALSITRDNLELLTGWERIMRARYSTGSAAYSDLIKVQVELGKLEDRVLTLEDQLTPARARLNALVDLPSDTPVAAERGLPQPPELVNDDELDRMMRDRNPSLLARRARVEQEEHGIELAGKSGAPRFNIGLDWIQTEPRGLADLDDDGKDPLVASVAVQVPLWRGKYSAESREARARRVSAEESLAARVNALENELAVQLYRFRDAQRKVALYRDALIPKGDQSLRAAYAAYEAGEGDFLQVLDAERALLEFGLSLERARADRAQAHSAITALVGGGIDDR